MKHQYFGDINDYRKYGILRALEAGSGLPLAMCWMLTPNDDSTAGGKTGYLFEPERWRGYDREVYDILRGSLLQNRRTIEVAAHSFLSSAVSHEDYLSRDARERARYFADLLEKVEEPSLVFFDPDNGLEVGSKPIGTVGAERYLYHDELAGVYQAGHSCLVYQHFPRERRDRYTAERAREVGTRLGAPWVATLATPHVLFILAPRRAHAEALTDGLRRVRERWSDQVAIWMHRPRG